MFSLARKQFPDQLLSAEDLKGAAELWRQWYGLSTKPLQSTGRTTLELSARIYGFAGGDVGKIQEMLPGARVVEGDQLEIVGAATTMDEAADVSPWSRVMGAAMDRPVVVMLYASVVAGPHAGERFPTAVSRLLLVGQAQAGGLMLKAVQRLGATPVEEASFRNHPWAGEKKFLEALARFRVSGDAKEALGLMGDIGNRLFVSRYAERKVNRIAGLLVELPGDHSPLALLRRLIIPVGMMITGSGFLEHARETGRTPAIGWGFIAVGAALGVRVLYNKAARIARLRKRMEGALAKAYGKPAGFAKVDLGATALANDINVVKFSADLAELGAVHCFDFQLAPGTPGAVSAFRQYYFPAEKTYVTLAAIGVSNEVRFFPAKAVISAKTYVDGEGYLYTAASEQGYRKAVCKSHRVAYVPVEAGVEVLVEKHRGLLAKVAREGVVVGDVGPDEVLARESAEHLKTAEGYRKRGSHYTWGDAIHEGFEVRRKNML